MTKILTAREYKHATLWQKAAVLELMTDAQKLARKKAKARKAQLRVLDAEFELAHERLLLVEEKRRIIAPYIPTEAEAIRRLALFRYNEPEGTGAARLQELVDEKYAE